MEALSKSQTVGSSTVGCDANGDCTNVNLQKQVVCYTIVISARFFSCRLDESSSEKKKSVSYNQNQFLSMLYPRIEAPILSNVYPTLYDTTVLYLGTKYLRF